ncbi:hypothetical protein [Zooshikella sp. RANM57]|uniref:hypothetical protein n=1 Tax=Zooshikella sp. RANM57 TaxID=3425863 RepID=UPI003D6E3710
MKVFFFGCSGLLSLACSTFVALTSINLSEQNHSALQVKETATTTISSVDTSKAGTVQNTVLGSSANELQQADLMGDHIWSVDPVPSKVEDGVPLLKLQANRQVLASLNLGQVLQLKVPGLSKALQAELFSTHNQRNNMQVWSGRLLNSQPGESILVTKGSHETYITISTKQAVYSVRINNETGYGTMINETQALNDLVDRSKDKTKSDSNQFAQTD